MHLMERKMGVGTGGRGCGGGASGECGQSSSLSFSMARPEGRGDRHLFWEHFHALAHSIEWKGLVNVLCVCVWGLARAAVGGGSVKTPRFCCNSRFHNGVKWSQEMFAWPRHCTVTWGLLYSRSSHSHHTHTQDWLSFSDIFTIIVV